LSCWKNKKAKETKSNAIDINFHSLFLIRGGVRLSLRSIILAAWMAMGLLPTGECLLIPIPI
jgi:hypothetical protein